MIIDLSKEENKVFRNEFVKRLQYITREANMQRVSCFRNDPTTQHQLYTIEAEASGLIGIASLEGDDSCIDTDIALQKIASWEQATSEVCDKFNEFKERDYPYWAGYLWYLAIKVARLIRSEAAGRPWREM